MGVNVILVALCVLLAFLIYWLFRSTNFIALLFAFFGWSRLEENDIDTNEHSVFDTHSYKHSYQHDRLTLLAYPTLSPSKRQTLPAHDIQSMPAETLTDEHDSHIATDTEMSDSKTPVMIDLDSQLKFSSTAPGRSLFSEDEDSDKSVIGTIRRAISTESVASTISTLTESTNDDPSIQITLCYERGEQMFRTQLSRLFDPPQVASLYLIFYLLPHPKPLWRTEARSIGTNPLVFNQCFRQCIRHKDIHKIALLVQLYVKKECVRLAGQCRIRLRDVVLESPSTLYLTLKDEKQSINEEERSLGEILFSLFYQHDRLSVVVMKLRELEQWVSEAMVRIYVVQTGGRVLKKKTSTQKVQNGEIIFNESVFINVSKSKIERCSIRLSIAETSQSDIRSIGHITIGPKRSGKEFGHFQRMLTSQDRPICMWHHIQPKNKII